MLNWGSHSHLPRSFPDTPSGARLAPHCPVGNKGSTSRTEMTTGPGHPCAWGGGVRGRPSLHRAGGGGVASEARQHLNPSLRGSELKLRFKSCHLRPPKRPAPPHPPARGPATVLFAEMTGEKWDLGVCSPDRQGGCVPFQVPSGTCRFFSLNRSPICLNCFYEGLFVYSSVGLLYAV